MGLKRLRGSQRLRYAVNILSCFHIKVSSLVLFNSRMKCSKGGRICNTPSQEGVRYV